MPNDEVVALEAAQEVVQTEALEVEASEATESTDGQPIEAAKDGEEAAPEKTAEPTRGDKKRAAIAESQRRERELSEELAAAQAKLAKIDEVAALSQPPKEDQFDNYEEYQASLAAYHGLKAMDDRSRQEVTAETVAAQARVSQQQQQRQAEIYASWEEQKTAAKMKYADFDVIVSDDLPISSIAGEMIASSESGADIAYYLGMNREFAARLAASSPAEQGRQIGLLEAKLNVPSLGNTTQAPDPITPINGGSTHTMDPSKMNPDEYRAWRQSGGKL